MYKGILILDKLFLKYEGGFPPAPGKTTLRKPSLIRINKCSPSSKWSIFFNLSWKFSYPNNMILKPYFHLPKKAVLFQWEPFKNDEKCFLFHLKSSFVKIFKILFWFFYHLDKMAWLEIQDLLQSLSHHNLVNKQLQYIYCPISHEVHATTQRNLVS